MRQPFLMVAAPNRADARSTRGDVAAEFNAPEGSRGGMGWETRGSAPLRGDAGEDCPPHKVEFSGERQRPKQRIFGPAATAMYCLPAKLKVIGDAFMRTLVGKRQRVLPVR